eukprot:UN08488
MYCPMNTTFVIVHLPYPQGEFPQSLRFHVHYFYYLSWL